MSDEASFLTAIRANPADDLPRLVYADWLEEHGQTERAEFVRVQVELNRLSQPGRDGNTRPRLHRRSRTLLGRLFPTLWPGFSARGPGLRPRGEYSVEPDGQTVIHRVVGGDIHALFRRGFIERVSGPLAVLIGDVCRRCGGARDLYYVDAGADEGTPCPVCAGTGTRPGVGPAVVAAHPVGRVVVTNREPSTHEDGGGFGWWGGSAATGYDRDQLPREIWALVTVQPECLTAGGHAIFGTPELALSALSAALIAWAKSQPTPITRPATSSATPA